MDNCRIQKLLGKTGQYRFLSGVTVPKVNDIDLVKCREQCANCEYYGKSYACPPYFGEKETIDLSEYNDASLLIKDVDIKNEEEAKINIKIFQNLCRMIKREYMALGEDVISLAEGKCSHCENCNCLNNEPCGDPVDRVCAMCGFGINANEYSKEIGVEINSSDEKMTLYGLFLTKK